uniref:Uncharacterized protein n=2 Tax=Gammaproteobacteria TaxID=1236 RepID=A0A514C8S2_MORMO|nr:hypothetical protein [Morganella morganii]QDX15435.1 hypothetical protein [Actinobacillus pleuropneumoniae]UNJ79706.1 hypothetical protein [Morganella morganii]
MLAFCRKCPVFMSLSGTFLPAESEPVSSRPVIVHYTVS